MSEFRLHSSDVDDLANWSPPGDEPWEVNIQVLFDGESFQFQLCSVAWVLRRLVEEGCVLTGRRAIVKSYRYETLVQAITRVVDASASKSWDQFAKKLNWYMQWEFENYEP